MFDSMELVTIKKLAGKVTQPIDPEFLPESLRFGEEEVYILPESELTFELNEDLGMPVAFVEFTADLVNGETYEVNFGGTVYNCTCVASEDGSLLLGNLAAFGADDTGEPFLLCVMGGMPMVIPLVEVQTAVVGVKGNTINTLDPKYAPSLPVIDLISLGCPTATIGQVVQYDWGGSTRFNAYQVLEKGSCLIRLKVAGKFGDTTHDETEFIVFASVVATKDISRGFTYETQTIFEGRLLKINWNLTGCIISFETFA